jgi:thiol-disulfide isomerase/thioredoxin
MLTKFRIALTAILIFTGATAIAAPQASPLHDPQVIDLLGYRRVLQQNRGKPLLVTFWATWCEPCRDEYPMINDLAKQYAPKGLSVVGVDDDEEGDLILMRRFIARYKPVFPNYRKQRGNDSAFDQSVSPDWTGTMPATFFYAKDGRMIGHFYGARDRDTFEAAIRALLAADPATGAPQSK